MVAESNLGNSNLALACEDATESLLASRAEVVAKLFGLGHVDKNIKNYWRGAC